MTEQACPRGRQWPNGIPAEVVKECVSKSIESAGAAQYLVDRSPSLPTKLSKHWGGVLEPLAAGSTRVWQGKNSKEAVRGGPHQLDS